jgi:hypothetical protein
MRVLTFPFPSQDADADEIDLQDAVELAFWSTCEKSTLCVGTSGEERRRDGGGFGPGNG